MPPKRDVQPAAAPEGSSPDIVSVAFATAMPKNILPSAQHSLPPVAPAHIHQGQRWDCGLACVAMVLSLFAPPPSLEELQRLCGTTSVWSIDLAHLLSRCGVPDPVLCTTFAGVRPDYNNETFYAPHMATDTARVTQLFETAAAAGVNVVCISVTAVELRWALSVGGYVAIALVDKTILLAPNPIESLRKSSYTGHYVLLYGYDNDTDSILIRDPAAPGTERLSATRLEAARKAHGTDEDLVFVAVPGIGGRKGSGAGSGGGSSTGSA